MSICNPSVWELSVLSGECCASLNLWVNVLIARFPFSDLLTSLFRKQLCQGPAFRNVRGYQEDHEAFLHARSFQEDIPRAQVVKALEARKRRFCFTRRLRVVR